MKKKNLKLGKLNLSKSSVASLDSLSKAKGGTQGPTIFDPGCGSIGPGCTFSCNPCPPSNPDPDPGSWPACQPTQGFTCGPVCDATNNSCGAIGCVNDVFDRIL
ncbi:hypothetical protein [Kordia sp.]|uniref:hypothetical protein n=1 Tax=Kordia sp. TaxID=1965332 RepID=UPI003D2CBAD4